MNVSHGLAVDTNRGSFIPPHIWEHERATQLAHDDTMRRSNGQVWKASRTSGREKWTPEMRQQILDLLKQHGVRRWELCEKIDTNRTTLREWLEGRSRPLTGTHARIIKALKGWKR